MHGRALSSASPFIEPDTPLMLKFFYSPGACSLAAHIVLEESGEPYEAVRIDISQGDQHAPEYRAIHRLGRVPVVVLDDGEPLSENTAILPFLGKRFGLWPRDDRAEVRALSLIGFLATTVHPAYSHIGRPIRYASDTACHANIQQVARGSAMEYLREVEALLGGREWFGGEYSVLDAYAFFFYNWAVRKSGLPVGELKAYRAFYDRMLARPGVRRVLAEEGLAA